MGVSLYICLAITYSLINPESVRDTVSQALLSSTAFLLVSISLLAQFPTGDSLASSVGLRKTSWPLLFLGALVGVLAQVPAERVHLWILELFPLTEEALAKNALVFAYEGAFEGLAILVALAVIVPIAEELFFRGAIFVALRRAGRSLVVAGFTTGIGFALCHPQAQAFLPIALVALIFTVLRVASASLYPSILAHIAFNAATVLMNLGLSDEAKQLDLSLGSEVGLNLLLGSSLGVFIWLSLRSSWCRIARAAEGLPALPREEG